MPLPDKCVVFDVWARFGYFRRHFTTTTATTHPIIPRSTVEGLIASIIGLKSEEYPDRMRNSLISVWLTSNSSVGNSNNSKIGKIPISLTYTHADFWTRSVSRYLKKGGALDYIRAPRRAEFLREPRYRIYFSIENESLYTQFVERIKNHTTYYTPFLGSSNMIANFIFVGEYNLDYRPPSEDFIDVSSIIPFFGGKLPRPRIERGLRFAIEENIPLHISSDRKASGFYSALYSPEPNRRIGVKGVHYTSLQTPDGSINIVFIPPTTSSA